MRFINCSLCACSEEAGAAGVRGSGGRDRRLCGGVHGSVLPRPGVCGGHPPRARRRNALRKHRGAAGTAVGSQGTWLHVVIVCTAVGSQGTWLHVV